LEVEDLAVQAATKILKSYKNRIIEYFQDFNGKPNVLYKDFLVDVQVMPEETISFAIEVPFGKGKKDQFVSVDIEFKCPLKAAIQLKNLPIETVFVEIEFPPVFLGLKGAFPKIIISCQTKKSWFGDFGLAWTPLTGSKDFRFHPFENQEQKAKEIQNFYIEKIVDPLCDFLNNSDNIACAKLRKNIADFLNSKQVEVFSYRSPFSKKEFNTIDIPIYCEYSEKSDVSVLYFECYIVEKHWMQPADAIMKFLQYISTVTQFFDEEGELIETVKIDDIESDIKSYEAREQELTEERRITAIQEEWDPFKPVKKVQRDEFGYIIEDGSEGFFSKESTSTLEKMKTVKSQQEKQLVKSEIVKESVVQARTSAFDDENAWYNAFSSFYFEIIGSGSGLDFRKRGDFRLLESISTQKKFILSFARDALRNKFNITTRECAKRLYELYISGHINVVQ